MAMLLTSSVACGSGATILGVPDGVVTRARFLGDDKRVVTGERGGVIRVWDVRQSRELTRLTGHVDDVTDLSVINRGKTILSCSADGTVRLWDVDAAKEVHKIVGMAHEMALAVSSDGETLAFTDFEVFGQPQIVRVWAVRTWKEVTRLRGPAGYSFAGVAVAPDGKRVAAMCTSSDHKQRPDRACLWETSTGKIAGTLDGYASVNGSIEISPDGRYLSTAGRDGVVLWNLETGKQLEKAQNPWGTSVARFSADGRQLLSGGGTDSLLLRDARTLKEIKRFGGNLNILPGAVLTDVDFSPDGAWGVAAGYDDGRARVWDLGAKNAGEGRPAR